MKNLEKLGLRRQHPGASDGAFFETSGAEIVAVDPATEEPIGSVRGADAAAYERVVGAAVARFEEWRLRPAPKRAELVRRLGELLREHKEPLGEIISREVGKIRSEGLGEVQEMIDVCDYAVGLGRQLYGLTIASERPRHRMMEQWHPLGPVGVITAFNFPMAVWSWNACLAAVCGDTVVWKPSEMAPMSAVAVQTLCDRAMAEQDARGVFNLLAAGRDLGERMVDDRRFPLVSFTGSVPVGRRVAERLGARLGRSLLELGGNNAIVVMDDADLDLALRAIVFGAVGTAGQRCTSTRRLFVQRGVAAELTRRIVAAYPSIRVGHPMEAGTLLGPLIRPQAVERFLAAIAKAKQLGGEVLCGGRAREGRGWFVEPAVVRARDHAAFTIAHEETFGPILYIFEIDSLEDAIAAHNAVPQGLSSAIFTDSVRAAETFLSAIGSDCGIANVNLGTSGAEIGGAFGGEKDTGGGRESGSDSWKAYMRRQTCTINWGRDLPLAQGVEFPV